MDPANAFNHKYLLNVVLHVCKNLKPNSNNIFKDLDDDDSDKKKFDPDSNIGKQTLAFMKLVKETNFLCHLLLIVNDGNKEHMQNQQKEIPKFGMHRLRSLEVIHQIFSLLLPSNGELAKVQMKLEQSAPQNEDMPETIFMDYYTPTLLRRQILKTCLNVLMTYSYCSVACQVCILILDQLKTMFDIIDIVTMQKFVINEFSERHTAHHNLIMKNQQEGNNQPIRRYWIDHLNLQSGQVNQMTLQLKEKIASLQQLYLQDDDTLRALF